MNCSYKRKGKTRGTDIILGSELVYEPPFKTKANIGLFQLRAEIGQRRREGRGWRTKEGSMGRRIQRISKGRDTPEKNGWKE